MQRSCGRFATPSTNRSTSCGARSGRRTSPRHTGRLRAPRTSRLSWPSVRLPSAGLAPDHDGPKPPVGRCRLDAVLLPNAPGFPAWCRTSGWRNVRGPASFPSSGKHRELWHARSSNHRLENSERSGPVPPRAENLENSGTPDRRTAGWRTVETDSWRRGRLVRALVRGTISDCCTRWVHRSSWDRPQSHRANLSIKNRKIRAGGKISGSRSRWSAHRSKTEECQRW